jgi:hypothetical protein
MKADERRFMSGRDKTRQLLNRNLVRLLLSSTAALIQFDRFFMTDRTKLTLASLAIMMLPYRVELC